MRLISWNIRLGGGKRINAQIETLSARKPDIVALQEVTPATVGLFRSRFAQMGFEHVADSFPRRNSDQLKGGRKFGELIASRWKFEQLASTEFGVPWPEKVLSVLIDSPRGDVEIHTIHVPNGSEHGRVKIETFEAVYKRLACNERHHRILCGDFNSPQTEATNGQLITWGQAKKAGGRFVIGKGEWDGVTQEQWDLGERSVLEGLRRYDLNDVFRCIHGYHKEDFSYFTMNRGNRVERRFDHIFASSSLNVVKCEYLHGHEDLSDHAPMEAVFNPDRK